MKLSGAMRKGSEIVPGQAARTLYSWGRAKLRATCALGAVYLGVSGLPAPGEHPGDWTVKSEREGDRRYPELMHHAEWYGLRGGLSSIKGWITTQNDDFRRTREEIAQDLEDAGL